MAFVLLPDCPYSWSGAHNFRPRYDEQSAIELDGATLTRLPHDDPSTLLNTLKGRKTYIRDICIRCGATIERQGQSK